MVAGREDIFHCRMFPLQGFVDVDIFSNSPASDNNI